MARKDIDFNTYVKRDLNKTTVDWGTVANKLTGDLLKIRKDREAERAEIQADTDEVGVKLNEMEDYTNQSLQDLALGMSGDSAEFLRVQNDLFKRGLITQTEFAQAKQRVLGDWKQFGNVSKRWESDYVTMVNRAENKDASSFEVWFNEQNSEFGNLKGVRGMVNPQTGNLSLIRPNADGSISDDPSRHVSMNVLQNRFNTRINNVTKDGAIDKQLEGSVDKLGELILADVDASGTIFSREGQTQALNSELVQTYLDDTVGSLTSDNNTIFSILGDMGSGYKPTFDPAEAAKNPKLVLVEYNGNGMPVPVEDAPNWGKQKDKANEILKTRMIAMLDDKEAYKVGDKDLNEYQRRMLELREKELEDRNKEKKLLEDEDYNAMKYRPNVYAVQEGKLNNKNAKAYLDGKLGTDIQNFFDPDKELKKVFNNVALAAVDPKIIEDLQRGEYGEEFKPYDFYYTDDGADRFVMEIGDKKIQYPPLSSSLTYTRDQLKTINSELKAGGYKGDPLKSGEYAIDSNGDGKLDAIRTGMSSNNEDFGNWFSDSARGIDADRFDRSQEILDYMQRYLLDPAVKTLITKQKEKYQNRAY
tara:strand:- start:5652 stop:7415 length:1764 start_codon:yes stop_codon:yes gene_type:complete